MTDRLSPARRLTAAAVALLAAGSLLSGCSSSTSTAATGAGGASTHPAHAAQTAPSPSSVPVAVAGGSGQTFCALARVEKANEAKDVSAYASDSPATLEKFEEQAVKQLPAFVAQAPAQLKAALEVLVTGEQKLFGVLQKSHFDVRKVSPTAFTSLQTPTYTKASKTVAAYLTHVCKIPSALSSS